MEKIKRWDTAEHLRSNDEINDYLESSFADGDEKQILRAIDNADCAWAVLGDTAKKVALAKKVSTKNDTDNNDRLGPITRQLAGIIKMDKDINYKELLTDILEEKYLYVNDKH